MSDSREKPLSHKQELALAALVAQPTLGLAAAQVKMSERTLYRWLHDDPDFKAEYLKLRREIVNNAVFQLQKSCNNAVNCLQSVINDPDAPASARVSAACRILEMSLDAIKVEAIEERLESLEARIEELNEYRGKAGQNGARHTAPTG
jgi:hypothetical protein